MLTIVMIIITPSTAHASISKITGRSTKAQTVYTVPSSSSASIGSVFNERVRFDVEETINGQHWTYTIYSISSRSRKSEFINN